MKILENEFLKYILYEKGGSKIGRIENYRICSEEHYVLHTQTQYSYSYCGPGHHCYQAEFKVKDMWRCWFKERKIKTGWIKMV